MEHKGTKTIETERLVLRPFKADDAEPMYRNWASDPEVTKYLTWPAHSSVEVSEHVIADWTEQLNDPAFYQWAIELKEIKEPVGSISVVRIDEQTESFDVGYCIGRKWWHNGITPEALTAVIAFLFDQVHVRCVRACHDTNNPNSGKVMIKSGMKYDGMRRQAGVNNQGIIDEAWYSILRSEYENGKSQYQ